MKIKVEETNGDIAVIISGKDLMFCANVFENNKTLHFWLTDELADSLAFHLGSILQDREQKKTGQNKV